jgi:hypothetical protein
MKKENDVDIKLTDSNMLYNYKTNVDMKILEANLLLLLQALQPFCWALASLTVY